MTPVSLVCDQGSNFFHMYTKVLKVSDSKPYFEVNGKEIVCFHDAPHLLKKCIQRQNVNVVLNGGSVKWGDIEHIFQSQHDNVFKCSYKITKDHVHLPPFGKMSVRYAAKVLSNSVSTSLNILYSSGLITDAKGLMIFSIFSIPALVIPKIH